MVTTWQLAKIRSINPSTMGIRITEIVDGSFLQHHDKIFPKALTVDQVLTQLALFIKQKRDQKIADRIPFKTLDLSNFEARVQNS